MKKSYLIIPLLFITLLSCKDECKDINCNYGICDDGTCLCDDGYEGINCATEKRLKFLGDWTGIAVCNHNEDDTEVAISIHKGLNEVDEIIIKLNDESFDATISNTDFTILPFYEDQTKLTGNGNLIANENLILNLKLKNLVTEKELFCKLKMHR